MRLFLLQICVLLFILAACGDKKQPQDVLGEEQFRAVLVDVMLTEAYFDRSRINPEDSINVVQQYYEQVFEKHDISGKQFYTSMDYYIQHPEVLREELRLVIDSLSSIEANTR